MAGEAVNGVGQSADATRQQAAQSTSAEAMVARHSGPSGLDTEALAAEVRANPQADASLVADLEARMTPVERGQFAAALDAANDNGVYSRTVAGETFEIGHPDAPDISTWGAMEPGTGYRDAWDRTAAALGTTDPAAITAELERQLYAPASTETVLDPIVVTASPSSEEGVGSFVEGAILGDFGDNNSWSATAGQVAMGFVPIAGQIADIRDTAAAIGQVWNGEEGGWVNLGAAAIGWIPGIGDAAKAAIRGGERLADAGGEIAQQAVRQTDDVATAATRGALRNADGTLNLDNAAARYAEVVNGNRPWSWRADFEGGFTNAERRDIRQAAIERGLIPEVPMKPGTRYADFQAAGVVQRVEQLPRDLWHATDRAQFEWLDARIPGGRPEGTTWHHSEVDGRMELVPFGVHNINPHIGGRSPGHWADAPR